MKKVIAISGPSGTGKTTLVHQVMNEFPQLEFSISATTRPRRKTEVDKKDYYFLTNEEFQQKLAEDAFIEYQQVYENIYYGTLKKEIDRIQSKGKIAILDIDVMGALNIKKLYRDESLLIFIHPGSVDLLRKRLIARGTDDDSSLKKRLDKAALEISFADNFDEIIFNDKDLESSVSDLEKVFQKHLQ